jgi:hypothetical protein
MNHRTPPSFEYGSFLISLKTKLCKREGKAFPKLAKLNATLPPLLIPLEIKRVASESGSNTDQKKKNGRIKKYFKKSFPFLSEGWQLFQSLA